MRVEARLPRLLLLPTVKIFRLRREREGERERERGGERERG